MPILDLDNIPRGIYFTFIREPRGTLPVIFWAMASNPDAIFAGPDVIVCQSQLDEALVSVGKISERRRDVKNPQKETKPL